VPPKSDNEKPNMISNKPRQLVATVQPITMPHAVIAEPVHPPQKSVAIKTIPEFCSRMTPTTEAGKAYKRRVCVIENVHSDIYFGQK
jgi:hypothetical protein